MNKSGLGLYVHIPFCRSRCIYCDFASSVGDGSKMDEYVEHLCRQIALGGREYAKDYTVDTLYFGGGTPTLLSNDNLLKIAREIRADFDCVLKEFSVEANPCTVDRAKLNTLKDMGVTRISLGVQTFNDGILKTLGRRHDASTAKRAIALVKESGFDVSVDCMLGLPAQMQEDIKYFVDLADELGAEHISAYMLSVEQGTALEKLTREGRLEKKSDDALAVEYEYVCGLLEERGYERYEVSNFCKNSKYSLHNLKYWQGGDYLGLGLSAHSLIQGERWRNSRDFDEYYAQIDACSLQRLDREVLSVADKKYEMIMLSLRLKEGLDVKKYEGIFKEDFAKTYAVALKKNADYISFDGERLAIKEKYLQVMNGIVVDFIACINE